MFWIKTNHKNNPIFFKQDDRDWLGESKCQTGNQVTWLNFNIQLLVAAFTILIKEIIVLYKSRLRKYSDWLENNAEKQHRAFQYKTALYYTTYRTI